MTKRRLRQTRSLDPAIIRHCDTDAEGLSGASCARAAAATADAGASPERPASKPALRTKIPTLKEPMTPSISSPSIPLDVSPSSNFHFDYDTLKLAKRNTTGDLPFLVRGPCAAHSGSTGTLFSPRRWLQRKVQPSSSHAYVVWKSEVSLPFLLTLCCCPNVDFFQNSPLIVRKRLPVCRCGADRVLLQPILLTFKEPGTIRQIDQQT